MTIAATKPLKRSVWRSLKTWLDVREEISACRCHDPGILGWNVPFFPVSQSLKNSLTSAMETIEILLIQALYCWSNIYFNKVSKGYRWSWKPHNEYQDKFILMWQTLKSYINSHIQIALSSSAIYRGTSKKVKPALIRVIFSSLA